MLPAVHTALGDQAQVIVHSATDAVLETLKGDALKDFDKKREIEDVLGPISSEWFSQLLNLSKKITDYHANNEVMADPDMERKDVEIGDEVGVAVAFDKEDKEEGDDEGHEIRDESDDEGEEGEVEDEEEAPEAEEGEELMIGGEGRDKGPRTKRILCLHILSTVSGFSIRFPKSTQTQSLLLTRHLPFFPS
jgi:pre-mRNA-splicing helicase BRR2